MAILLSRIDELRRITLDGAIDVGAAAELKAALVDALASGEKVCVQLEAGSELDVTAFQLLWAAGREAERSGVELRLAGPLPEAVRKNLASLGLPGPGLAE